MSAPEGVLALAKALVAQHFRVAEAKRPVDRTVEAARLDGMCRAAHALGIGMTPFAVELALTEAVRSADERPVWRAIGNQARKDFDDQLAHFLAAVLEKL